MIRTILTITLNDLRVFFASRGNLIGLILLPVTLSFILGWAFSDNSDPERQRIDLLDLDQSELSNALVDELHQANETLLLCPVDNTPDDACGLEGATLTKAEGQDRVRHSNSQALIVIPQGYAKALAAMQPVQIDFYSTANPSFPSPVQRTLEAVLQRANSAALAAGVADAMLEAAAPREKAHFFSPQTRDQFSQAVFSNTTSTLSEEPPVIRYIPTKAETDQRQANGFNQSVPGMGAMYTMFTVLGGMITLFRERRQWTLQRLVVLPISKAQLLAGKICTYFVLGMIQYLLVFGVGYFMGVDFGQNPLALLSLLAAFVLCVTALAFAIAPHISSEGQANGLTNLLGLSLAPLGGAWWPLEIVPSFMRTLGHLSPVAWVMDGLHQLIFNNAGFSTVLPEISVLVGAAVVLFAIAVRTFKYE
ncbi:MAG: ABC transporter permease [Caldilineaceae bacterium]